MSFFENQSRARAQTNKLVILYIFSVLATSGIIASGLAFYLQTQTKNSFNHFSPVNFFLNPTFLIAFTGIILFILCCSFYKIMKLSTGGKGIAEMVGATLVDPHSSDPMIKKYINIVEEMALASGTPIPGMYVLAEEMSINAFAAGYNPQDAVVAVSRGALEQLNRDELQGVVAHEFSHILNGDMKLNIKLMGYIFGLSALVEVGNVLIRSRSSSSSKKGNGGAGLGLVFIVFGAIGMFFASLIRAAISRQREFLADASAVQFTRNPLGIGGALKKILRMENGAKINSPNASEIAHLFFGQAVSNAFSFFATHPPLPDRIMAIDKHLMDKEELQNLKLAKTLDTLGTALPHATQATSGFNSSRAIRNSVGEINPVSVELAQNVLSQIPESLKLYFNSAEKAALVCYALLLAPNSEGRNVQAKIFSDTPTVWKDILDISESLCLLDDKDRLPFLQLGIPALKKWESQKQEDLLKTCLKLIQADGKLTAIEFIYYQLLLYSLNERPTFFDKKNDQKTIERDICLLLSFIILIGKTANSNTIFTQVTMAIFGQAWSMLQLDGKSILELGQSLDRLRTVGPKVKGQIFEAAITLIQSDEKVTPLEYEGLRLISAVLDIPLPLLATS